MAQKKDESAIKWYKTNSLYSSLNSNSWNLEKNLKRYFQNILLNQELRGTKQTTQNKTGSKVSYSSTGSTSGKATTNELGQRKIQL